MYVTEVSFEHRLSVDLAGSVRTMLQKTQRDFMICPFDEGIKSWKILVSGSS